MNGKSSLSMAQHRHPTLFTQVDSWRLDLEIEVRISLLRHYTDKKPVCRFVSCFDPLAQSFHHEFDESFFRIEWSNWFTRIHDLSKKDMNPLGLVPVVSD
jgi:hypothetical protein